MALSLLKVTHDQRLGVKTEGSSSARLCCAPVSSLPVRQPLPGCPRRPAPTPFTADLRASKIRVLVSSLRSLQGIILYM